MNAAATAKQPAGIIPLAELTIVEWIKCALRDASIPATDTIIMNGYTDRNEVKEAVETISLVHRQSGAEGVQSLWRTQIAKLIPDIADTVERRRRIYHCSELRNIPPVRWLINGEIPEQGFIVMFGPPEVGKTFVALDYSERIAHSRPVVYVIGEGKSGFANRHEAWLKHHKQPHGKLYFVDGAVLFTSTTDVTNFIEDVRPLKPQMIVLDTLARCFDGDENSAKDMGAFIRNCDRVRYELETAVMVLHHAGKYGSSERGSSALRGACDAMIEIADEDSRIKINCSKLKDGKHFDPRYVQRIDVTLEPGITSCVILPAELVKETREDLTPNQRTILEAIYDNPLYDRGAKFSQLKQITGLADSSLNHALKSLAKRGIVKKTGQYEPYILTEQGNMLCRSKGIGK
jgi:hypothetical protein